MLLAALVVLAPAASAAEAMDETDKLLASDGGPDDRFGEAVAVDGDTAIVGGREGAAYVFVRDSSGGWSEQINLTPPDGQPDDRFGTAVALDGDTAIVGASGADTDLESTGAAYVFTRDGTSWGLQATLAASDGTKGDVLGASISLDGDTAVVGAWGEDDNGVESGAAYVFERNGTSWVQQAKLLADDGAEDDFFGVSVSLDGDTALVGAVGDDNANGDDAGAAYVFTQDGTGWAQQSKLTAGDGEAGDEFGSGVALDGDTAVVGARSNGGDGDEKAYAFGRDSSGTWSLQDTLDPSDALPAGDFGWSVSLDGDHAVVGEPRGENETGAETGAAHVFARDGAGNWVYRLKLLPSDGESGDWFGESVAVNGSATLAGARFDDNPNGEDAGSAYVFEPFKPRDLRATAGSQPHTIELDWTSLGGPFHVKRSTTPGGPYTEIATTPEPTYTDTELDDQRYHYVVTAENATGAESEPSTEASAHPRPSAPGNLAATPIENEAAIDLDWDAPSSGGPFTYKLYRSTQSGGPYTLLEETTSTSETDGTVEEDTTYYYMVTAIDDSGLESPRSEETRARSSGSAQPSTSSDDIQDDGGSGGDASDDPDNPTILAGGEVIHINGTLIPAEDPVDAYGTEIEPKATKSMSFDFASPAGMALELRLIDPAGTVRATDQAPLDGGQVFVEAKAPPGEHLQEGVWVAVLEHGLLSPRISSPRLGAGPGAEQLAEPGAPEPSADSPGVVVTQDALLPGQLGDMFAATDYRDERRCDPRC